MFKPGESGNKEGRPKGISDRRAKLYNTQSKLIAAGFDPIDAMIAMAMNSEDEEIRFKATKTLLDRVVPVLKAIEVKGEMGSLYHLNINMIAEKNE